MQSFLPSYQILIKRFQGKACKPK
uniref:Uncharacterized protein n=1 Tax=Physcomitrium patens TaxID=3218 RepID=A0A2K1JHG0_PHYPA|nr:hypothetical protein PHYPA_018396 [Physcomitrium patens]